MKDGRNFCRADPPSNFKGKRPVAVLLDATDYRALYEQTMIRGISMQETIRELIREAPEEDSSDKGIGRWQTSDGS